MATAKKDPKRDPALLDRLDVWARAFTKRPDVNVNVHTRGKPWKSADGSIYAGPEILAFYTGANGYSLEWCLRDQPDVVSTLSIPSYKSTVVVFNPFRPLGQFTATFANAMLLDAVRGKNKTLAARPKLSSKTATVISLFTGRTFDSFEA